MIIVFWMTKGVLALLFCLSVWSVSIIIDRARTLKKIENETIPGDVRTWIETHNWTALRDWTKTSTGIRAGTLRAALETNAHNPEQVDRGVKSYLSAQRTQLEKGFTALATLGSNAPFIGLFGTVLGIIHAFGALSGQGGGGTQVVMAAIAEALIATAIGLFVAIPAVVSFNVFSRKLRLVVTDCESLRDFYISRLEGNT